MLIAPLLADLFDFIFYGFVAITPVGFLAMIGAVIWEAMGKGGRKKPRGKPVMETQNDVVVGDTSGGVEAAGPPPTITVGMDEQTVEGLLGAPRVKQSAGSVAQELTGDAGAAAQLGGAASQEFAVYDHPAGTYELIYQGGQVAQVHSQPS